MNIFKIIRWTFFLTYVNGTAFLHAVRYANKEQIDASITLAKQAKTAHDYQAFLEAEYLRFRGKLPEALQRYQNFLAYNPSLHAHGGLFLLLSDLGEHQNLIKHYEDEEIKFKETFKGNTIIQLAIAQSYLLLNKVSQAEAIFAQLAETNPENEQVVYFATMAFIKTNQLDKANEMIQKCLSQPSLKPKYFLFHFLQAKVFFQQNKMVEAKKRLTDCLALSPKFSQAVLFQAIVQEQLGLVDDAINGYEHFLSLSQRDVSTEKHVISLLFNRAKKGDYERAIKYLEKMNAKTADYYYDLALLHFQNKDTSKALKNVEQTLTMDGTMPNAILLKIKILSSQKSLSKIITFIQQLLEKHPNNVQILHVYQLLKNMGVPINKLINAGIVVLNKKPSTLLCATIADLCIEAKDLPNAEKLYGDIIKQSKNPLVKAKAQYQICYLLFHCGKDDVLEKRLLSTLNDDVVDPGVYNLLAYHYGTHNKELVNALSYIEKALTSKPEYAPFLDTKAYVLLKLGKTTDAYKILETAHRQAPNDKIIQQRFIALQSML